jgi:hypothetical protein
VIDARRYPYQCIGYRLIGTKIEISVTLSSLYVCMAIKYIIVLIKF